MRSMTQEEVAVWRKLRGALIAHGNHEISRYLDDYDINLTSAPGIIGYATSPSEGQNLIVLNREKLLDNGEITAKAEMVCFHEMLHLMLRHIQRDTEHLKRREPKIRQALKNAGIDNVDDMTFKQLENFIYQLHIGNIAADLDLSRYYNLEDVKDTLELGGLLITQHPEFLDMDFEEIYDTYLDNLEDQIKNQKNKQYSQDDDGDGDEDDQGGNSGEQEFSDEFKAGWARACKDVREGKINPAKWSGNIPVLQEAVSSDFEKGYAAAMKAMQDILNGKTSKKQKSNNSSGQSKLEPLPISPTDTSMSKNSQPQIGDRGDDTDKEILKKEQEEREDKIIDELSKKLNKTKEEIKKLVDQAKQNDPSKEERLKEIQRRLDAEDAKERFNDIIKSRKIKQQKNIQDRQALNMHKASAGISNFRIRLVEFLRTLEKEKEKSSFARPSRRDNDDDRYQVVKPGITTYDVRQVPLINVYFDISGSFESYVQDAIDAVDILYAYKRRGLIDYVVYFVLDDIYLEVDDKIMPKGPALYNQKFASQGRTANGPAIMNHIIETKPDNIILMTDGDTTYGLGGNTYNCPGKVWCITNRRYEPDALLSHIKVKRDDMLEKFYL